LGWLNRLRREPRCGPLVVIGHSEGALVATFVATLVPVDGLVLIAGAGRPAHELIEHQLGELGLSAELVSRARDGMRRVASGEVVTDVPSELRGLLRPSVQPYLTSWFTLNPAAVIGRTSCPVLIVHGGNDLHVRPDDARRLAAARPDAELVLIEGMNHVLKVAPTARSANLATYDEPALPLAPGLVESIAAFVIGLAATAP
ncbi:MAG: alpha/beta fold hydrolase, partial [Methylobacteriaceae bacterium]|nr:alpha/beta fold hydrolase [Methylobacteriaceae bacterium]